MGFIKRALGLEGLAASVLFDNTDSVALPTALTSPWATGGALSRVAWSEIYGGEIDTIDRTAAMQVPSIARARNLLVSTIAPLPLRAYRGADSVPTQPSFLYRTNGPVSPYLRTVWTLDDLFFHGMSLWAVQRGSDGQITDAVRVPWDRWHIDGTRILVDNKAVSNEEVLFIPGAGEGLLLTGANTIRGARAIERAWVGRIQSPVPMTELHQLTDDQLTPEDVRTLVGDWDGARQSPTGAVGFTPHNIELRVHGETNAALFENGRNALRTDVANLTNIPTALLDGSAATGSLTYDTRQGQRNAFLDTSVPYWTAPIEARLSMDDAVPRGQRVRFDTSSLRDLPASPIGDLSTED